MAKRKLFLNVSGMLNDFQEHQCSEMWRMVELYRKAAQAEQEI